MGIIAERGIGEKEKKKAKNKRKKEKKGKEGKIYKMEINTALT